MNILLSRDLKKKMTAYIIDICRRPGSILMMMQWVKFILSFLSLDNICKTGWEIQNISRNLKYIPSLSYKVGLLCRTGCNWCYWLIALWSERVLVKTKLRVRFPTLIPCLVSPAGKSLEYCQWRLNDSHIPILVCMLCSLPLRFQPSQRLLLRCAGIYMYD